MEKVDRDLQRDVAKLLGKPPYDGPENICRNDNYFGRSLRDKYGELALSKEINRQQRES
jgi:hypothetical protein